MDCLTLRLCGLECALSGPSFCALSRWALTFFMLALNLVTYGIDVGISALRCVAWVCKSIPLSGICLFSPWRPSLDLHSTIRRPTWVHDYPGGVRLFVFFRTHISYLKMNRQRSFSRRKPRLAIIQLWLFPPLHSQESALASSLNSFPHPLSRLGQAKA